MTLVLLDENMQKLLTRLLIGYDVRTVASMGWRSLSNGRLSAAARDAGFTRLVTVDRNMGYQQSLPADFAVVVVPTNKRHAVRVLAPAIGDALARCADGTFFIIPDLGQTT